jgi:ATP-binding cassette subfamily F protein 3
MVPSNFMLLDEPTNHLDMRATDVLLTALQDYNGTVVFVSHDRYFIDILATRVIEVEDGQVKSWPGNYEDYMWRKQGGPQTLGLGGNDASPNGSASASPVAPAPAPGGVATVASADGDSASNARGRLNPIKLRQMKDRRRAIEDEVTRLEVEIADYEVELANFVSMEETQRVNGLLEARRADLESLMTEWEEVASTIEANS